jgi:hypothetical protein
MKKAATATRPLSAAISNESRLKATTGQGQTEKHHGGQDLCEDGLGRQQIVRHVANGPGSAQVTEYLLIYRCDLRRSGWQVRGAAARLRERLGPFVIRHCHGQELPWVHSGTALSAASQPA